MRTALIAALALFASSTAFAGPRHHTRPAQVRHARVITVAPAPVVMVAPPYRAGHVWIDGHWDGRYWVPGHWEAVAPPPHPGIGVSIGVGGVHVAVNSYR